jgi:hypothetical protein
MYGRTTLLYVNRCAEGQVFNLFSPFIIVVCLQARRRATLLHDRRESVVQAQEGRAALPLSEMGHHIASARNAGTADRRIRAIGAETKMRITGPNFVLGESMAVMLTEGRTLLQQQRPV